ncbi:MAG: nickel-dependent lactate racemase [Thermoanaerobacteraceae bacterium]|nr:nickel-dependent lactate racemase [Thermoanaerobacteraceae bacterium]
MIKLHYGEDYISFELPEEKISWIASPNHLEPVADLDEEVKKAIKNPVECPTIPELVKRYGKNTVIIVDDFTRVTPVSKILPILLSELNEAGVQDADITILIGLGTHRPMTEEECREKIGREIYERVKVVNHTWNDPDQLVYIGETPSGIPIRVNKLYYESDVSIAIGNIIPHIYAGYSAGAKLVQPGVSGPDTTARTHLVAAKTITEILGNPENIVRHEMEDIAKQTGLKMIINTVMNTDGTVVKVVSGDVVKAHREGVKIAEKIYAIDVPDQPDMVICSSYPAYQDLWQSVKPMTVASMMVKKQGIVILLSPCPEGDCPGHPDFTGLGIKTVDEVFNMVNKGLIEDEVAASVNMTVAAVREMAKVIVVTEPQNGIYVEKLGLKFACNVEEALNIANELNPNIDSIGIITHGADLAKKF